MASNRKIIAFLVAMLQPTCWCYTTIQPPVQPPKTVKIVNAFDFINTTAFGTDVIWRGTSLTQQQPGWSSNNTVRWTRRQLQNFLSLNMYSNGSDTSVTQGPTTANGPLGNTTTINYLMIESKLGVSYTLNSSRKQKTTISINRSSYHWPGGKAWAWYGSECANSSQNQLSAIGSIESLQGTEFSINWRQFKLLYNVADNSSQSTTTGSSGGTTFTGNYGKNWGNFLQLTTPLQSINAFYNYQFEFGDWQDTGQYAQANISYDINNRTAAVLKLYSFTGSGNYSSSSGAVGTIRFKYQSPIVR